MNLFSSTGYEEQKLLKQRQVKRIMKRYDRISGKYNAGSVAKPHGNWKPICLSTSLPTHTHTYIEREFFTIVSLFALALHHVAAQHPLFLMASALHTTSTCMWH